MKKMLFVLAFALVSSTVLAQTPTATAIWLQSEPPAVANAFTGTLQIDTAAPVVLVPTCIANGAGSTCSAPVTLATPTANHSYVLVICNNVGCAAMSVGGAPPGSTGFKIKVTVIVGGDDEDDPAAG